MNEIAEEKKQSKLAWLNKIPQKWRAVVAFSFLFFALVVAVLSGIPNNATFYEENANYIAKMISGDSVDGDYLSVIIESENEEEYPMPTSSAEFRNTYGSFGEDKPYFASTVNSDKTFNIVLKEIPDCPNVSVLYSDVNANISYKGHYKQEYYPLEIMFKGNHDTVGAYSFVYISQSQANVILSARGVVAGESGYTEGQYETLLGTHTRVEINGEEYTFSIGNVYLEQNYYYEGLKLVMQDFVMMQNRFPKGINRQGLYFFNTYEFHNEYFMKDIKGKYSSEHYSIRINEGNVVGNIDESKITSFYYDIASSGWTVTGVVLLLILAIGLAASSLFLCRYWRLPENKMNLLVMIPFAIAPYLIFKLIYAIVGNIYLYSNIGMLTMALTIIAYLFLYAVLSIRKKEKRKKESS